MPVHDHTASVVSLARALRGALDESKEMTSIKTASLALVLDTFVHIGQPSEHEKMTETAGRTVAGMMHSFGAARGA